MKIDLDRAWPPITRSTEICIVGCGPAGITAARQLLARGHEVIILEAEGSCRRIDAKVGDGSVATSSRAVAAGPCAEFTHDIGFPQEWPLAQRELDIAYEQARRALGFPVWRPHADDLQHRGVRYPGFDREMLEIGVARVDRVQGRFDPNRCDDLAGHPRCTLITNATALEIGTDSSGHSAEFVRVMSPGGTRLRVDAKAIIVAAGPIETCRLLLASRSVHASGLGNQHGNVGRYLAPGRTKLIASVEAARSWRLLHLFGRSHSLDGEELVAQIRPAAQLCARERIGTACLTITIAPPRTADEAAASDAAVAIPRGVWSSWLRHRTGGRAVAIRLDDEQPGERDSRVLITNCMDEFDRPGVEFRTSDGRNAARAAQVLLAAVGGEFARLDLGIVRPTSGVDAPSPRRCIDMEALLQTLPQSASGTTRMASSPACGVVDDHGAVFGIDRLWIVGPSVLPSGGGANSLLAVLALSHRTATEVSRRRKLPSRRDATVSRAIQESRCAVYA